MVGMQLNGRKYKKQRKKELNLTKTPHLATGVSTVLVTIKAIYTSNL